MIHDVSTDPDDPPPFIALRETRLRCKNGVSYSGLPGTEHRKRNPDIVPAVFAQAVSSVHQHALATVKSLGWAVADASTNDTQGRIEATATTRILRFKDDVVIRTRAEGNGTRLDIRSASRVGRSDLGVNARRIRTFLLELNNRLKSIS